MPIGGLINMLSGQTDFRARTPTLDTKAGSAAIGMRMRREADRQRAQQYSMAAGGLASPLALREAQRRGSALGSDAIYGAGELTKQLEQGVMQQNAANSLQAQQINAEIARHNAGGIQKLAGAAVMGGALAMSDENAKMPMAQGGIPYSHETVPARVIWTGPQMGPAPQSTPAMWQTPREGYDATAPAMPRERMVEMSPRVSTPVMTMGGELMSDERAKQKIAELESANRGLTKMLERAMPQPRMLERLPMPIPERGASGSVPHAAFRDRPRAEQMKVAAKRGEPFTPRDEVEAEQYGRQWLSDRRMEAYGDDVQRQVFEQKLREAQAARDLEEQAYRGAPPAPAMVPSDARGKMYLSDERAKAASYLGPVKPVAYEYKPEILQRGEGDPGPQYGLLAQDLARTPQGASTVVRGPDGMLRVQVPQLLMLNTAADSEQQREIERLKRRVG